MIICMFLSNCLTVCQKNFLEITNKTSKLSECFPRDGNVRDQGKKWLKSLNDILQQSFRKIQVTSIQKETEVSKLFDKRLKVSNQAEEDKIIDEIDKIEESISDEVAKDMRDKIVQYFETLANNDGTTNINGMWTLKRKIFPKHRKPLPVAKKTCHISK